MRDVEVRYVARLVTLCGCTREMGIVVPAPHAVRVALRPDPALAMQLDDASLHVLFEDEPVQVRTFTKHGIERPSPDLVVVVYVEQYNEKGGRNGR